MSTKLRLSGLFRNAHIIRSSWLLIISLVRLGFKRRKEGGYLHSSEQSLELRGTLKTCKCAINKFKIEYFLSVMSPLLLKCTEMLVDCRRM